MNGYPVIGGRRRAPKRFEFISMAQIAIVGLGPLIIGLHVHTQAHHYW